MFSRATLHHANPATLRRTGGTLPGPALALALALAFLLLPPTLLDAQQGGRRGPGGGGGAAGQSLDDRSLVNRVAARSIGPAVMSGRIVDIAVAETPGMRGGRLGTIIYIAAATGGIWKSTSGGVDWEPIFDDAGVGSMGDVTVAPSNANIVWVGTGEPNNQRSSSYGDGVYKSVDAGETFEHMGLRTSQHVGRIVIHPGDPEIVYVAAVGPLWAPGGERGLYRTMDGGESWEAVLTIDQHTGVTDIAMDPTNPDILYAAALQRERRAYSYVGGGPGSGIYKSIDGGDTWTKLTRGLPTSDMGRIGLDISLSHPQTVYAVIEGSEQGVYRTDNGGRAWRRMSDIASIPWYFGQIRVDPQDPEVVYHLGVPLQRSMDGGVTWASAASGGVHVDHHAMWINPEDPTHLLLGNDGGFYVSHNFGDTWDFSPNLPLSQFYAVGIDMQEPFFGIYGGLQDNSTWGGPSATRNSIGVVNADWFRMQGGDGFFAAIDPNDHNIAFVESQNGNLVRFNGRTGERKSIRPRPAPGEDAYRFNWSSPIQLSPFDPATVYFAGNHVFKSPDRGDSWQVRGLDLTREIDRNVLPMMGSVPANNAVARHQGTAVFSNISTMHVSSHQPGHIVTGTDDGQVSVTTDDGVTWRRMTDFPDVPDTTYVSKVRWSAHDEATIYATFDGHRSNDFNPYVLKSTDQGQSWTSISGDLPEFGNIRAFAEHHENPNVLFVGTEIRPFVTLDGGESWVPLENGIPPSPVHDIKIHHRDNALVVATHGRGFYVIDDLNPIVHMAEAKAAGGPYLFPVADAFAYVVNTAPSSGIHAGREYRAPNPAYGAGIAYYMPEGTRGERKLEIVASDGQTVRTLETETGAGLQQARWDLRWDAPWSGPPANQQGGGGGFGGGFGGFGGGFGGGGGAGPPALGDQYTARLTITPDEGEPTVMERSFTVEMDDLIGMTRAQLAELQELRLRHRRLSATQQMAARQAQEIQSELRGIEAAMARVEVSDELQARADELGEQATAVLRGLRGGGGRGFGGGGGGGGAVTVQSLLGTAGGMNQTYAPATDAEKTALEEAGPALDEQLAALNELVAAMPAFRDALDAAGVPWTPGRPVGRGEP